MTTRFYNARILRENAFEKGELWVSEGKIIQKSKSPTDEVDVQDMLIAPGYIDLQINGGFGVDFSLEAEKIGEVAQQLPQFGVTSFLPTLISSAPEHYRVAIAQIQAKMTFPTSGAQILGIHLEGPFLNPLQKGAHRPKYLKKCSTSLQEVYANLENVKMVTLAPELDGASVLISEFRKRGIVISAGHTCATLQQMEEAIVQGVGCVTHLFNAMNAFHHREPGVIGAVLTHHTLPFSMIGDPYHIHPKVFQMVWQIRGHDLILVSDAMAALGLASGTYKLGTMEVEVRDGGAYLKGTEKLAGSIIGLDSAVRYLHASTGCTQAEAIRAATVKPAVLLGLLPKKGTLEIGADADFNFLDDYLFVRATYVSGLRMF